MTITISQLHPHIGAEIGGLDLREPADAATVDALWRAIDRQPSWCSTTSS
jgi:alpha-ketoglutarate-dependent taurine dioxygenase